tara:strand:- start:137 stop:682 length:546 start_codon:yes stop_codon:yes gene_type:complete
MSYGTIEDVNNETKISKVIENYVNRNRGKYKLLKVSLNTNTGEDYNKFGEIDRVLVNTKSNNARGDNQLIAYFEIKDRSGNTSNPNERGLRFNQYSDGIFISKSKLDAGRNLCETYGIPFFLVWKLIDGVYMLEVRFKDLSNRNKYRLYHGCGNSSRNVAEPLVFIDWGNSFVKIGDAYDE